MAIIEGTKKSNQKKKYTKADLKKYDSMSPKDILIRIPPNKYQQLLTTYYEQHYDFYCYFKNKIVNKESLYLGEYESSFFEWFRGVMVEHDSKILTDDSWKNSRSINGTIIEEVLNQDEYICDTYIEIAAYVFEDVFGMLQLCEEKIDYEHIYNKWYNKALYYLDCGYIDYERFFRFISPKKNEKLNGLLFVHLANVKKNLTKVGVAYYDEICENIKKRMDDLYEETGVNFLYHYATVEEYSDIYPLDSLAFYWPTRLPEKYKSIRAREIYIKTKDTKKIKEVIKAAENEVREKNELPRIGEGWIAETVLYNQIKEIFNDYLIEQHYSPSFLGKQHYDIYFPECRIAIEYQGEQHFKPIDYFGGEKGLRETKDRDIRKKEISKINNVKLIEVMPDYNIKDVVFDIANYLGNDDCIQRYNEIKEEIDDGLLMEKHRSKILKVKNVSKNTKSKIKITDNDKKKAKDKLKNIEVRFREGEWVKWWYYQYMLTNADLLDLGEREITEVINKLKRNVNKTEGYIECIKRGILKNPAQIAPPFQFSGTVIPETWYRDS